MNKKKLLTIIGGSVAAVVVLIIAVAWLVLHMVGQKAAAQVQQTIGQTRLGGQEGVNVDVGEVQVDALARSTRLQGLSIGNPDGYEGKTAIVFGELRMTFDKESMKKDAKVRRATVAVARQPVIHYGTRGKRDNLGELLELLDKQGPGPLMRIDELRIEQAVVELPDGRRLQLNDVILTDVGGDNGIPAREVIRKLLTDMRQRIQAQLAE